MSERILITILLPVPVTTLCNIHRGLARDPSYKAHLTFMRQVGDRLEIYEKQPEKEEPNAT